MSEEQDFLRRWSRLKRESAAAAPAKKATEESKAVEKKAAEQSPVPLPSLDSLTFESDFKAFMHAKVEEGVKRAALKKLFADPRFNVMDGLDTYIGDYTRSDTIPADMFERMARKREKLFNAAAEKARAEAEEAMPQAEADEAMPQAEEENAMRPAEGPAQTASNDVDPAQDPKAL
jgi:hypothetical protein